jgi:hypothetical protein
MIYGRGNVEIWTRKAPTLKKRHVPLDKPHSEIYISARASSLRKSGQLRRRAIDAWAAGMYF